MKRFFFALLLPLFLFGGCAQTTSPAHQGETEIVNSSETEQGEIKMKLFIDGTEVECVWAQNDSVKALAEITPLQVETERYGGFEQVGEIGKTLPSNNRQMTTEPGDVVLYASSNLVVFFGSNSWSYTKLGHIELNERELKELLDKPSVQIRIQ